MSQATRDRQDQIMTELLKRKHVTVRELASAMAVSEATVRRDLRVMAHRKQIALVHGGATLPRKVDFSFQAKHRRNIESKQIIAELAADLIADGDQIFLDSGTTCFEMAAPLQRKHGISILVNSARLATELHTPELSVIMLGGQYRPERMDTVGPITTNTVEQMRGYMGFVGADGLSMDCGPSAVDIESADLYRVVVKNAREAILLADHTKFESAALYRIVEWSQIDRLVTDRRPAEPWEKFLEDRQIEVIHPDAEPCSREHSDKHSQTVTQP